MERTRQRLKIATNFFEFDLPKTREPVQCHSRHEYLYILMAAADPSISEIESQPEKIRAANGKTYIPDVRVKIEGRNHYVEIKSQKELESAIPRLEPLLAAFARSRNATYEFVDHERIDANEAAAILSLKVTRWALQYRNAQLGALGIQIRDLCAAAQELTLHQLICHFDKYPSDEIVGGICVLIQDGLLQITNSSSDLNRQTKVRPTFRKVEARKNPAFWRST